LTTTADAIHNADIENTAVEADVFGKHRPGHRPDAIVIAARCDPDLRPRGRRP
jgi:hypothetical protein